jgi:hypothetical protein
MSSMINDVTRAVTGLSPLDPLSSGISASVISLLVLLLVQREVMSAFGRQRASRVTRILEIVIAPLLMTFAVIVARRALEVML